MRPANDMPRFRPRAPGRGRVTVIVVALLLFLLITSIRQIADLWTDYLWFDSVNFSQVWSHTWAIKIGLGVFFSLALFAVLWLNLAVADRASPAFRPLGPEDELLSRYHDFADRRAGSLRVFVALVFGLITGAGMASQWNEWLLFSNGRDFGTVDPQFGLDIGFYVFKLPFLAAVVDWAFASLVIVLLVTAVAHYLNGGIRLQSSLERMTPQVKAHLSLLLALLALVKAVDYFLQRYQILFSSRGTVNGATNTEVNATLPAQNLLLFIALASFALFIINIRRRGWVLPLVSIGLWVFVQLIVGTAYPAFYQRFFVQPAESDKEALSITHNIEATRKAYGLDKIVAKQFDFDSNAANTATAINNNPAVTRNVQILDPKRVLETFQQRQSLEAPLQFTKVATDRYPMRMPDGTMANTQVVVSNREMNAGNIPQKSWQSEKLNYTHGYGLVLAAGNAVAGDGAPNFAVKDIPLTVSPSGAVNLPLKEPNNYYFSGPTSSGQSQTLPDYSVVDTGSPEFDYVRREATGDQSYSGKGGVLINSFFRRAAFWLRFGNLDLVISDYVSDQSRILFVRDVRQRAIAAAPFLAYDNDPYPAVVDNHNVYILDAYTTSDMYPNAEHYPNDGSSDAPSLALRRFNYVRNSVKVVIDTYDGSLKYYINDKTDPIINAYAAAFPDLFHDKSEMSQELTAHLRYPEDIFTVQTDLYGRYHIDDSAQFYSRNGAWEPPPQPPIDPTLSTAAAAPTTTSPSQAGASPVLPSAPIKLGRMAPYYVLNKLQDDQTPNFMLMRAYQPFSEDDKKTQLASFLVARSDGNELGQLESYQITSEVQGPSAVNAQILSNSQVSPNLTLLGSGGSKVVLGDLLLVPIEKNIVWVRALYVVSNSTPAPLVRFTLLYANGQVYMKQTLREALATAFPGSNPSTLEETPPASPLSTGSGSDANATTTTTTTSSSTTTTSPSSSSSVPPSSDVNELIKQANQAFADGDALLKNGDVAGWAAKVKLAQDLIARAQSITTTPTTTTSTTAPVASPG